MPARTLVTGFGSFLSVTDNPSARLAASLNRPYQVLDVSYEKVDRFLDSVDPTSFENLLLLGVAASRGHVSAELFARNWRGSTPDVSGASLGGPITGGAPLLKPGTLFQEAQLAALLVDHPSLRLSLNAGSFLCNYAYFRALELYPSKGIGFVHVAPFDRLAEDRQLAILRSLLSAVERD